MLNVIDAQDDLKMMSDQQLLRKAQEGDPRYPQYLIVAEKQNRDRMRKEVAGRKASDQTVAEQIMYGGIQSQRPPQMAMMPPQMPAMPPQVPMMPPQMAQAPQPPMQMMSDGGVVKLQTGTQEGLTPAVLPETLLSQKELDGINKLMGADSEDLGIFLDFVRRTYGDNSPQSAYANRLASDRVEASMVGADELIARSREATDPDFSELTPMTFDEIVAGATRAESPMPPLGRMVSGAGELVSTGARNLANRLGGKELAEKIFGPIPLQSSDVARSGILSGTQALSSLIEGDSDAVGPLEAVSFGSPQYVPAKQNVSDYVDRRIEDPFMLEEYGFGKLRDFFDVSDPQTQGNTDVSVQGTGSASLAGADSSATDSYISNLLGGLFKLDSGQRYPSTREQGRNLYTLAAANPIYTPDTSRIERKPDLAEVAVASSDDNPPAVDDQGGGDQGGGSQSNGGDRSKGLLSLGDYESIFTKLMDATDKSEFKETPKVDFSGIRDDARGMGIATILGSIGAGIAGGNLSQGLRDATGAVDRLGKRLSDIGMAEKMSDQKATIADITRRESRLDKIRGYSLQIQKLLLDAESADASLASRALSSIPMVMRELTASLQNVNLTDDQRNAIAEDLITYNNQFRNLSSRVANNYPGFGIVPE